MLLLVVMIMLVIATLIAKMDKPVTTIHTQIVPPHGVVEVVLLPVIDVLTKASVLRLRVTVAEGVIVTLVEVAEVVVEAEG